MDNSFFNPTTRENIFSRLNKFIKININIIYTLIFISALVINVNSTLGASPSVHEITMATPDIIRVEVREVEVQRGHIIKLEAPVVTNKKGWTRLPDGTDGMVIGSQKNNIRLADTKMGDSLNRKLIDQPGGYGLIGTKRVVAVYRKSVPWSSGKFRKGPLVSFKHFVYLQLDRDLSEGTYVIQWPDGVLPPTTFDYAEKLTRTSAIRATQLGHTPKDSSKYAYLALWLPNGPHDGAVDFRKYGLKTFEVINAKGVPVFEAEIELRIGPHDPEPGNGFKDALLEYTRRNGSTYTTNRAGTFVFGLDYSKWVNPTEGTYRLHIPGLGVSDPFQIAHNVWEKAARVAMAGFYHQRSGLALDGRFGYLRPECFTKKSGVTVFQSRLPFAFSQHGGGFIPFKDGIESPWITSKAIDDARGGYHDAGDWDRRIQHVRASYFLLDVFEQISNPAKMLDFNLPESHEVLKHPLYKGRNLPDIVDEAIWNIDFYRRLQHENGAVPGGIESGGAPKTWEPCWLESNKVFIFAPDPSSTFAYAAAAAKLSIILNSLGEGNLAKLFSVSALHAWNWAESRHSEAQHGYADTIRLLENRYQLNEAVLKRIHRIQTSRRLWAAATLFRLTGLKNFMEVAEGEFRLQVNAYGVRQDAGWEYLHATWGGRSEKTLEKIRKSIIRLAGKFILEPQSKWSYKSLKLKSAPMGWGRGLAPSLTELGSIIRSYKLTGGRKEFIVALIESSAHILGANQIGISFTIGLGRRWHSSPLHEDSIAAGVDPPHGITVYGWAPPARTGYWWLWSPAWAALSDKVAERRVEPGRKSLPIYEYIIEHPRIIMSSEYTVHQTIATTAAMWIYLHSIQLKREEPQK